MEETTNWTKLHDLPFGNKLCVRSPLLINDDIILSVDNDNNLYKFNTKSQDWSPNYFGDYSHLYGHVISNDHKKLYIFDGWNQVLLIMDIAETLNYDQMKDRRTNMIIYGYIRRIEISLLIPMDIKLMILSFFGAYHIKKIIKEIKNLDIYTGSDPVIMLDPDNNDLLHIIGGGNNNKHLTINTDNGEIKTIYTFDGIDCFRGAGIMSIPHQKRWYLMHGSIPIHIFDIKTRTWNNTKIKMPLNNRVQGFGYIITHSFKYIVLFGGEYIQYPHDESKGILVFDIDKMKYKISTLQSPKGSFMNAVITKNSDIHLFGYQNHCKINISEIIQYG